MSKIIVNNENCKDIFTKQQSKSLLDKFGSNSGFIPNKIKEGKETIITVTITKDDWYKK